jgi:hypothetical protein
VVRLTAIGQRLFLATYDNSRAMRIYFVDFTWLRHANKQAQEQEQKPQLNPALEVTPLTVQYMVAPSSQNSTEAGHMKPTPYALTRLEFIPEVPDPHMAAEDKYPTIVAVFSVIVNSPLLMHGPSIVCKWNVKQGPQFKPLPIIEEMAARSKITLPKRVSLGAFIGAS